MPSPKPVRSARARAAVTQRLTKTELFRDVPDKTIAKLLQDGEVKLHTLEAGKDLVLREDGIDYVHVILSGHLEVRLNSDLIKKGPHFLLAFRGPDQIVGEMSAIARKPSVAFISACEPCELVRIKSSALERTARKDWRIYRNIANLLVKKTLDERRRIEVSLMSGGKAKVAQALINFLDERGADPTDDGGQEICGVVRQRDIADYIGCDRTTATRHLSALKKRGIISYPDKGFYEPHRLTVRKLPSLVTIARSKS
jgi:CRP-like cAMP-binding protein